MSENRVWHRRVGVALLLMLAAGLRIWGLDFGLPILGIRPDEEKVILPALTFFSGDYNPHLFNYPTFYLYLLHIALAPAYLIGRLGGHFGDWLDLLHDFRVDPTPYVLFARSISAALSVACVWLIVRLGRRLGTTLGGFVGAGLFAVSQLPVREAHFATVDGPQAFFVLLSLLLGMRILQPKARTREVLRASIVAGLTASVKYTGGIVVVPLLFVVARWARGQGRSPGRWILGTGALSVGVFALASPFVVLDPGGFWESFSRIVGYYGTAPEELAAVSARPSGWAQLVGYLSDGLGLPLLILGGLGLLECARRGGGAITIFAISYFVLLGVGRALFSRYSLPLAAPLCLGAGLVIERTLRSLRVPGRAWVAGVLALLVAWPTILDSVHFDRLSARPETRNRLVTWIQDEIPADATLIFNVPIGLIGSLPRTMAAEHTTLEDLLAAPHEYLRKRGEMLTALRERFPDWPPVPRYDVIETGSPPFRFDAQRALSGTDVYLIIADRTPWAAATPVLEKLAMRQGEIAWERDPKRVGGSAPRYDELDAFYIPLKGLEELSEAGPKLTVYRLRRSGK